jgi:NADPH-dependent curcumin reductase CurA
VSATLSAKLQRSKAVVWWASLALHDEKCARLVDELGFDAAVNYKSENFRDEMKAATPDRIDIYFDNTGGDILQTCLFRMATFGRIW